MINKKLSDLFLRKQTNKKEQPKQNVYFDENYFHCKLVNTGINTELIRVQTQLKQNGQPLDQIKCKWFIKNSHDFRQIQQVTSQYYQPCLDDVGSIICVQIEPFIEGKKYNGITIMKQSDPIHIDQKLEEELGLFLSRKQIKLDGRIDAVFSQNQKYESLELPAEIKVEIANNQIAFYSTGKQLQVIKISSEYPNIEFIRKSFNSILLNFNERESFKVSFFNNFSRDLFTLITRTVSAHTTTINPEQITEESLQIPVKQQIQCQVEQAQNEVNTIEPSNQEVFRQQGQTIGNATAENEIEASQDRKIQVEQPQSSKDKIEEPKQNNTLLILKLDEQNKQLKIMKRQIEQLKLNYNIEKQAKKSLEAGCDLFKKNIAQLKQQLQEAQSMNKKLLQVNEDNRFYKNELAILRKESKKAKERAKQLERSLQLKKQEQANKEISKLQAIEAQKMSLERMRDQAMKLKEEAEADLERMKLQFQKLQNANHQLKKKLQSLLNEKNIQQAVRKVEKPVCNQSEQKVVELEMKLKNLEMLLRYKSTQGDSSSNFQILVNKLTETISEKQLQLNEFKRINKNLLQQLKEMKNRAS